MTRPEEFILLIQDWEYRNCSYRCSDYGGKSSGDLYEIHKSYPLNPPPQFLSKHDPPVAF